MPPSRLKSDTLDKLFLPAVAFCQPAAYERALALRGVGERMGIFPEVEAFVQAHRACGELTWITTQPTPKGYRLWIACPCGASVDRWVTRETAEDDLVHTGLTAFPN